MWRERGRTLERVWGTDDGDGGGGGGGNGGGGGGGGGGVTDVAVYPNDMEKGERFATASRDARSVSEGGFKGGGRGGVMSE